MSKTNFTQKPLTETIPMTTMVEVPVFSDDGRDAMIASLHEAEADIRAGRSKTFTPDEFEAWLSKRAKDIRAKKQAHDV